MIPKFFYFLEIYLQQMMNANLTKVSIGPTLEGAFAKKKNFKDLLNDSGVQVGIEAPVKKREGKSKVSGTNRIDVLFT